jgi:hypothetical protein
MTQANIQATAGVEAMSAPPPPPYYQQPYGGPPPPNMYGPQQYPAPVYMPQSTPQPIIINTNMSQATAVAGGAPQFVTVQRKTNHALCCLICILTSGFSTPCWIYSCIVDG